MVQNSRRISWIQAKNLKHFCFNFQKERVHTNPPLIILLWIIKSRTLYEYEILLKHGGIFTKYILIFLILVGVVGNSYGQYIGDDDSQDVLHERIGVGLTRDITWPPPIKQIKLFDFEPENIKCNSGLELVLRINGSPACVKPESIPKLIERGWAQNIPQENISSMMERGNTAMGFNQTRIIHHFKATSTGGEIMIVAINENDTKTINEIRDHVKDIQYEFSQGNFTKPFFIHDQVVPGTQAMAENKDKIQYSTMQIDRGSVLILATNDTELLGSIQQFMDFQSSQHLGH